MLESPARADADALLQRLADTPDDAALREQAARQLLAEKRPVEATAVLQDRLIHVNAHETGTLPCLCKRCMEPEMLTTSALESRFTRDFTVAEGRVLFFWLPDDLAGQARRVRRSVHVGLRHRLR